MPSFNLLAIIIAKLNILITDETMCSYLSKKNNNNVEPYSHSVKGSFLTYYIIIHTITAGMIPAENIPY